MSAAIVTSAESVRSPIDLTSINTIRTLGEPSVPLDALRAFRHLDSRCPGQPEYRWTSSVETTTWPLGQGVATSVGMAIARRSGPRRPSNNC
jgi:transketolase